MADIRDLTEKIQAFTNERDWRQFHSHKNLLLSTTIELGELMEHFQWNEDEKLEKYIAEHKEDISDELADVCYYLFEFADNLGIDLSQAIEHKLVKNAIKYPAEKVRGDNRKYTEYAQEGT